MEELMRANPVYVAGNNDQGCNGGMSWWIIILFLFLFGGNGFGFNGANSGMVTKADLTQGFDFNNLNRQVLDLNTKLGENTYLIKGAIDHCCCETNRNIDAIKSDMYNQTNVLANAIHAEGEATRALINSNTMQTLRDENQALKFNVSQTIQTKNILDNLGRYVTNPPCQEVPYYFNGGCNFGYQG